MIHTGLPPAREYKLLTLLLYAAEALEASSLQLYRNTAYDKLLLWLRKLLKNCVSLKRSTVL